jgi:hypothetical protein
MDTARPSLSSNAQKLGSGIHFQRVNLKSRSNAKPKQDRTQLDNSPASQTFLRSSAGFFFGLAVILALGLTTTSDSPSFLGFSVNSDNELNEVALATAERVIDASVPTSSSAYVAVALGESIGGIIGAAFSVLINILLRPGMMPWNLNNQQGEDATDARDKMNSVRKEPIVSQALSDGDYFIANSATDSLLVAIGVAPEVAKLSSVFIAAVPSQLVKLLPKLREQMTQEEIVLQQLLEEQQQEQYQKQLKRASTQNGLLAMLPFFSSKRQSEATISVDPTQLIPVTASVEIDFVEIFADVTRWLEYE